MIKDTGDVCWQPSEALLRQSQMARYMSWLRTTRGLHFENYSELWEWSTSDVAAFWGSLWEYFEIRSSGEHATVRSGGGMLGTRWFEGERLNFAWHLLNHANVNDGETVIEFANEVGGLSSMSWGELRDSVASVATFLQDAGVQPGDRVVGYLPNIPPTVVTMAAAASIGVVWAVCPPEYETEAALERLAQLDPTVLVAADGYHYGGRVIDRRETIHTLQQCLPTLREAVYVPYVSEEDAPAGWTSWHQALSMGCEFVPIDVSFEHPLWVLFSSGTTGLPKAIVHSHGGTLLEQLKVNRLHYDLDREDRYLFYSTTGWMVWNALVSGLLSGATIILYDGSPTYPYQDALWELADRARVTVLGTGAAYISATAQTGNRPIRHEALADLRLLISTGSPLPVSAFDWARDTLPGLWLASVSGGTDVCTALVGASPLLPVRRGRIQCRLLGVAADTWDSQGHSVRGLAGELVVTEPMPSMPIGFWNDPGDARYLDTYFAMYPGVWRQGDWAELASDGSIVISGRSDSTINRQGVRMGSAEFYAVLEDVPEVLDTLVVGAELVEGGYELIVFVALAPQVTLDDNVERKLREAIRRRLSPRHLPDLVLEVDAIPRGRTGKKLEVPVKRLVQGVPIDQVADPASIDDPEALLGIARVIERQHGKRENTVANGGRGWCGTDHAVESS